MKKIIYFTRSFFLLHSLWMIIFIVLLLFYQSVAESSQKSELSTEEQASKLTSTIAASLYGYDLATVASIIEAGIKNTDAIRAVDILDSVSEKVIFEAYKSDDNTIHSEEPIPEAHKKNLRPFISPVIHEQEKIAELRLYVLPGIKLSAAEEAWLETHPVIRVHNEMSWPPFNFNLKSEPTGYSIDYMNLLAEKLGIRVDYVSGPSWNDFLGMIKKKELDVMLNIVNTEERRNYILFTDNYLEMPTGIYVKEGSQPFSSLSELKGLRLTLTKGFFEQKLLEKYYPDINLYLVKNGIEMLDALSNGKSDVMIGEMAVMNYLMRTHAYTNIKLTGTVKDKRFDKILSLGVRKDWPVLRDILQKGMNAITFEETRGLQEKWVVKNKAESWAKQNLSVEEQEWLAGNPVLHIGYDTDWPPVEYTDKNGQYQGISAEYMALIADHLGVILKPADPQSWSATIKAAKSGELDILPAVTSTPQREAYLDFTTPYLSFPMVMVTGLDFSFISDIKTLVGKKVAVVDGYAPQDMLIRDYPELSLFPVKNIADGLNAVRHDDADVFIDGLAPVSHIMSREGIPGLKISGEAPLKFDLAIGIHKDKPILTGIIQKVLDTISEDKRNEIFNRWVSIRYERGFDYSMFWKIIIPILFVVMLVIFWNRKLKNEVVQREVAESNLMRIMVDLETAKKEAETATQTKSDFLANMSHEIRTPMNAVIGMTYLMKQTESTPIQRGYILKIESAANSLLGIINDILDFSKIEAGKLDIEIIDFNLGEVIENVTALVEIKTIEKNLDFIVSYDPVMQLNLRGDPLRLGQILTNLLNNAVKFTEQGEVGIYIKRVEKNLFRFEVRDTGIGLTKEQQKNLFKSFSQADASTTRKYGGTGLGLAISKQLVEMMDGHIWVESVYDSGSTFIFEITLKELPHLKNQVTLFSDKRVLIVDDTPSWQVILNGLLQKFEIQVDVASSGEEAITKMCKEKQHFDMVLMDWQMTGIDGIETSKIIMEQCKDFPTTIIMVSAYSQETVVNAAREQGIMTFLSKPVNPKSLDNVIMEAFGEGIKQKDLKIIKAGSLKNELTTLQGSTILLAEDNRMNREIIHGMLGHSGIIIEDALNGKKAVEMYRQDPEKYELILMDIQMPEMDGYQAAQIIRETDKKIPIIALTANAMISDIKKTEEYGLNEHLNKPIEVEKLFATLLKYISKKCEAKEPLDDMTDSQENETIAEFEHIDTKAGRGHMAGDAKLYKRILNDFVSDYSGVAVKLRTIFNQDPTETKRITHTLKGLSANIGAMGLYTIAAKLDETQDAQLITSLEEELVKVIDEIRKKGFFADDNEKKVKKKQLSDAKRDELMQQLTQVIKRRRPQLIEPVLTELSRYNLNPADEEMLTEIKPLVKKFKFKDALNIIETFLNEQ